MVLVESTSRESVRPWIADLEYYSHADELYHDEFRKPTEYAFRRTRYLLEKASIYLQLPLPEGTLFPDGDGGFRSEWSLNTRHLSLMIPYREHGKEYLYHEESEAYGVEYHVTPKYLAHWLQWCMEGA